VDERERGEFAVLFRRCLRAEHRHPLVRDQARHRADAGLPRLPQFFRGLRLDQQVAAARVVGEEADEGLDHRADADLRVGFCVRDRLAHHGERLRRHLFADGQQQ
jgi:hypothetical protein